MADTIRDCIESVARQVADVGPVQHIVVDGGSDDGTLKAIAEYPHVELIHEPARGIYVAMNRGIAAAQRDVVGIVNADDILEEGALAAVSAALAAHPQMQIVAGLAVVEQGSAAEREAVRVAPARGHRTQSWDLLFHGSMPTNAYFFRRGVFEAYGAFNTDYEICADRELFIRFKLAAIPILPLPQVLYRYLAHEGSTTLNAERRYEMRMCRERIAIAQLYIAGGTLSPALARCFRGWIAGEHARIVMAAAKAGDWPVVRQALQDGMKASVGAFLLFLVRRAVAIPTAGLRRWLRRCSPTHRKRLS